MNRCGVCGEHKYMELYRCVVCDVCKTDYKSYVCDNCYKFYSSDLYHLLWHKSLNICKSCRREEKLNKIGI